MGNQTGRLRRSNRLLDSRDFLRVLRQGRRRSHPEIVVVSIERDDKPRNFSMLRESRIAGPRLGITASRKVGNAVVRNRFKRRIRAWFRTRRSDFSGDLDLVVIARRPGVALSLEELDRRLSHLMKLPGAYQSVAQLAAPRGF